MSIMVAPSILSADFSELGRDVARIQEAGCDFIHIDVMDGAFVPNMSFGPVVIKSIEKYKQVPFDVHLMIEGPERYIENFRKAGADIITVHAEASKHLDRLIAQIKATGARAGVALNPGTPLSAVEEVAGQIDMLLLMSVNPGFGGQKYISYITDKIARARALLDERNPGCLIEVDGGIDGTTAALAREAGANVLVAGSFVFGSPDLKAAIETVRG